MPNRRNAARTPRPSAAGCSPVRRTPPPRSVRPISTQPPARAARRSATRARGTRGSRSSPTGSPRRCTASPSPALPRALPPGRHHRATGYATVVDRSPVARRTHCPRSDDASVAVPDVLNGTGDRRARPPQPEPSHVMALVILDLDGRNRLPRRRGRADLRRQDRAQVRAGRALHHRVPVPVGSTRGGAASPRGACGFRSTSSKAGLAFLPPRRGARHRPRSVRSTYLRVSYTDSGACPRPRFLNFHTPDGGFANHPQSTLTAVDPGGFDSVDAEPGQRHPHPRTPSSSAQAKESVSSTDRRIATIKIGREELLPQSSSSSSRTSKVPRRRAIPTIRMRSSSSPASSSSASTTRASSPGPAPRGRAARRRHHLHERPPGWPDAQHPCAGDRLRGAASRDVTSTAGRKAPSPHPDEAPSSLGCGRAPLDPHSPGAHEHLLPPWKRPQGASDAPA